MKETRGLSTAEVDARLRRDGPNVLPSSSGSSMWRALGSQFVHFFALLLWAAGSLAFVAAMPQLGVAIFLVVIINAGFAFAQEYRAERAAERLRELLPRRVTVVRDGMRIEIDASEVVVDDVVILAGGDRIPADLRAREVHSLMVDTSTMTGESVPIGVAKNDTLLAGTFVTEGEAVAITTATGVTTRLAGIAALTKGISRPQPPLARELHRVVRTIAFIAVGVGAAFFAAVLMLGTPPSDGFVFAIGVTVALVPEGLLPTVTLSLAIGAQRMAEKHALIRRLEAVETLGSTTFICTDKTGTLTLNEMSVVEVWTRFGIAHIDGAGYSPEGAIVADAATLEGVRSTALAAARCSTGRAVLRDGRWVAQGDPMEAALDVLARRAGVDLERDLAARPERHRFPFDARRRRMSLVIGDELIVKGAPDAVLPRCSERAAATEAIDKMTARGLRVIAVATRPVGDRRFSSAADAERGLKLTGIIGLEDPPRAAARDSIEKCRQAGIKVAMVTGDHPATAAAIARETGLLTEPARILVGDGLPEDEPALGELVDHDGIVIARVAPEQKLRIARALRARRHVVAMTGDGVNDGPALQEADIGIAMGRSGTDVAREAADLVLLDDDFATIVAAVEQGRAIFSNAKRFLTYHLTDNVAELTPLLVWALSGGRFPLALGVMQILALDIGTDTFSAIALGAEPPSSNALRNKPTRGRLLDAHVARRAFGIMGPLEGAFAIAAFLVSLLASGWRPGEPWPTGAVLATASGATFATVVIAQTFNAFACRSATRWAGRVGWFSNPLLVGAMSLELAIAATFLWLPGFARALDHAPPSLAGWVVALSSAPAVVIVDAIYKVILRKPTAIGTKPLGRTRPSTGSAAGVPGVR